MSRREAAVIEQVQKDWRLTTGGVLQAALISLAIDLLVKKHGGRISIKRVIGFLNELSRTAERFKESIVFANQESLENQSEPERTTIKFSKPSKKTEFVEDE